MPSILKIILIFLFLKESESQTINLATNETLETVQNT